jgi:hypothetical protein
MKAVLILYLVCETVAGHGSTRTKIIIAGLLAAAWMAIDYHQYALAIYDRYFAAPAELPFPI